MNLPKIKAYSTKFFPYFVRIFIFLVIFGGVFGVAKNSLAAEHYIRSDASGANNGSDWANAWDDLPDTLVRGDTYYMADGSYVPYHFDDAEVGTDYITIKKATVSDHGIEDGWNDAYGDGQAIFTGVTTDVHQPILNFTTGYYIFDGVTGNGNISSSYGFKVTYGATGRKNYLLGAPGIGHNVQIDHVQIMYTSLILTTIAEGFANAAFYSNPYDFGAHDIIFSNNYILGGNAQMVLRNLNNGSGQSNTIIENNYFDSNWTHPDAHGGVIVPGDGCYDVTVRNNTFNNPSVFVLDFHKNIPNPGSVGNRNWDIYNNIVIQGANDLVSVWSNGDSLTADVAVNIEVHHNTHIGVDVSSAIFVGNLTDPINYKSYAYNNLFYNSRNPRMDNSGYTADVIIHSHNAHYNSTGTYDNSEGGTAIDTTGDPFIDSAGGDYRLVAGTDAIDAGLSLVTPFNIDRDGITRPQGSGWDIGAYEYQALYRADVDGSSQITTTDALLTLRNSLGLSMTGTAWQASSTTGDVNCDGSSNSTDALLILRQSLGLSMNETGWCG